MLHRWQGIVHKRAFLATVQFTPQAPQVLRRGGFCLITILLGEQLFQEPLLEAKVYLERAEFPL